MNGTLGSHQQGARRFPPALFGVGAGFVSLCLCTVAAAAGCAGCGAGDGLALWENFERYDAARPFLPWALRFALNKARQHAAREGRRSLLLDDEVLLEKIAVEQELQRPEFEARRQRLRDCLEKLPGEHSGLVRGYYWDRLSTEQLAERARSSVEAVYKRLQRIRILLLDCVQRLERKDKPLGDDFAS